MLGNPSDWVSSSSFFGGTEILTQCFTLAKQALYHLKHTLGLSSGYWLLFILSIIRL
jgi:hypothetical protein